MYKQLIEKDLKRIVQELGFGVTDALLSIPENSKFGDYSSNIALQQALQNTSKNKQTSQEIANEIIEKFGHPPYLEHVEVAGPGFLNFYLNDKALLKGLGERGKGKGDVIARKNDEAISINKNPKKYLIEYGHANPLKEIHIGHLRTFILGESLARILQSQGNEVFRANYQGDIGLHIAQAIWGIKKIGLPTTELKLEEKAKFMGQAYAEGNKAYKEDEVTKKEIDQINTKLYQKDPEFQEIYHLARDWSLEYFTPIYELLGIKYDRCFFESEVFERGKQIVEENTGTIFEKNDGAIIFPGEKYGLHTRVFITQANNPTYEGKEIGLAELEYQTFPYDKSIHVVANEQSGYFQVVIKAIEQIFLHLKDKKYHHSYGFVNLKAGKMSSRTGNVVTVDDILNAVSEKVEETMKSHSSAKDEETIQKVAMAAIKFSYLKVSSGPDIVFDIEQSISLQGDSGPYLLYSYARIQSLLNRAKEMGAQVDIDSRLRGNDNGEIAQQGIEEVEREVLRQLEYFDTVVESAAFKLQPNEIANYLLNLAKSFNSFYEHSPIIGSEKQAFRLLLVQKVAETLKKGLYLLGIETVDKM